MVVQQKLMQEEPLNVNISPSASQTIGGANISWDVSRRLPLHASAQCLKSAAEASVVASGGPRDFEGLLCGRERTSSSE